MAFIAGAQSSSRISHNSYLYSDGERVENLESRTSTCFIPIARTNSDEERDCKKDIRATILECRGSLTFLYAD
jgi:hypothetical protein